MTLPFSLRALRKARGLSQDELGQLLGLSQSRVARIETDQDSVAFSQICQVLEALGAEVSCHLAADWAPQQTALDLGSVYVLPHRELPFIKVGKARDVRLRAEQIGAVDLSRGYCLIADSERGALRAEKILHRAFSRWRLQPNAALAAGLPIDGHTEWFSSECLRRLLEFAQQNKDLLGVAIDRVWDPSELMAVAIP
jgi:HTH-type transcriptional regulator/antitoxin HipB